MKKIILSLSIVFLSLILIAPFDFAEAMEDGGATTVDPTAGGVAPAAAPATGTSGQQQQQKFSSCAQADYYIQPQCTGNPSYVQYQSKSGAWRSMANGGRASGASQQLQQGQTEVTTAMMSIDQMMQVCQDSYQSCVDICGQEHQRASAQTPPNSPVMNQANTTAQKCKEEYTKMNSQAQAAKMDLNQILQTIMAALQMLQGMGGDSAQAALTNPDEDPCEGQYKDILIECNGQSDPKGTRAGISGTGVGALNSANSEGLFQAASQDEAGGKGKGNNPKASGMGAGGGGMGGFGGGSGSMGGSGSGAAGDGEKGLDTDIHKGFMSADGGGGSGGGGGSSGSPAAAPFGKYGLAGGEAVTKDSSLQKKLNQLASSEKRGLASSGDTNGPFQDNWEIIKKAYKNNTQTMFHQK